MLDVTHAGFDPLPADEWDWEPRMVPIFDAEGREIDPQVARGIARSDTGAVIGTAGSKYHPVSHMKLIRAFEESIVEAGIDPADVTRRAEIHEGGAKMTVAYLLDKHVVQPKRGDVMKTRFRLRTSHNLTWSVSNTIDYLRLVCTNGMVLPNNLASIRAKHTTGFSADAAVKKIKAAVEAIGEDEERFARYATKPVTEAQARWFFSETIARRPHAFKGSMVYEDKVEKLLAHWRRNEDQTVWGVYNTLTHWSTHHQSTRGQAHNVVVQREAEVATALRSEAFAALAA